MTSTNISRATEPRPGTLPLLRFPPGFIWGAATAAYQIEGAAAEEGRTPSIWDTFSHTPGAVLGGDTGDVAVDHYHRFRDDVALMADLGLGAYRFSIAWPRIVPAASGEVNEAGLDFYRRLVDDLIDHGIAPIPTLYHWDLPQWLQDNGGWLSRDTPRRFAELADTIARSLGDRLGLVITLNEPWCSAFLGHATGVHAPGIRDATAALTAAHHLNLAHGLATTILRGALPSSAQVGLTLNPSYVRAASESAEDREAARAVDAITNRIFTDPVFHGRYPDDLIRDTEAFCDWSFVRDGDLEAINMVPDVLGVNYYTPARVAATGRPDETDTASQSDAMLWPGSTVAEGVAQPGPRTGIGWHIDPDAFTALLLDLSRDHPETPIMVTENGAAFTDVVEEDGSIRDLARIDYLHQHIAAVHRAIEQGADIGGYFVWTLMDNFEWAWGYSQRFGLFHVDYDTLERSPKQSAHWFRQVVAANAVVSAVPKGAEPQPG